MKAAVLRFDGGAKPGNATAGAVLVDDDGRTIAHAGVSIGNETNNVAEHTALAIGLELASACDVTHLKAFGDSALVFGQAFQGWGAEGRLAELAARSRAQAKTFEAFRWRHVPRELNAAPDALCHALEERWWLPPGGSHEDGTARLGFVVSLEVASDEVLDMRRRNMLKKTLSAAVDRTNQLARERVVKRTNAEPYIAENGLAIITYLVTIHVGEVTAGSPERRADVEMNLLAAATGVAGVSRARVARVSG